MYLMYTHVRENALLLQRAVEEEESSCRTAPFWMWAPSSAAISGPNACGLVYVGNKGSAVLRQNHLSGQNLDAQRLVWYTKQSISGR